MTFKPIHDDEVLSDKIISQITDNVVQGHLKPGDKLPTERELAEQFRVSRTVIRDAVKTLAGRGLLQVKHGRLPGGAIEHARVAGHRGARPVRGSQGVGDEGSRARRRREKASAAGSLAGDSGRRLPTFGGRTRTE